MALAKNLTITLTTTQAHTHTNTHTSSMCLYPRLVTNPKYTKNKKNGGNIPPVLDKRALVVPVACGVCMQCMKQKAREWNVRLNEEIKHSKNGIFVTLTFNNESIRELCHATITKRRTATDKQTIRILDLEPYERDNAIATIAVRRFLERWRKEHKKSVKHWLVTELGHQGTENIHLHGIIWTDKNSDIKKHWKYGIIWDGYTDQNGKVENYVNGKTINYITKYINKIDKDHKYYKPKTLCSDGLGKNYANSILWKKKQTEKAEEYYRTPTGHKVALPTYLKNKIFTEDEREQMWMAKLDNAVKYINGLPILNTNIAELVGTLKAQQQKSEQLGYGKPHINWERQQYERLRREHLFKLRYGEQSEGNAS